MNDPLGPGPNTIRLAQKVDTKETREQVYCALIDNDILWLATGAVDPVNAIRCALAADEHEDDYVFVATALVMLARIIEERIERDDEGMPIEGQSFVRRLIDGDD